MSEDAYRKAAVKRINDKRSFWRVLGVFVIVSALLTAIWAMSGAGYFWPMWAMFGMGIAAAFMAWGAYGPAQAPPSEAQIDAEMRKMRGQ
ncbi:MAG: 2TM domain-containing protein [Candidatus Nanopelagicales bacterium]|jgi:hypothetical protein|nr:2TM domain-containing protein [Candidatus Nanopelagicales bacterium]MCU0294740.1 2TM domain-containing protein [Candidatus Nanopelagicales bacterium]